MRRHCYIFFLLGLSISTCLAQQGQDSRPPLHAEIRQRLYYGKEYFIPYVNIKGTRSFDDLGFVDSCTIKYEGIWYDGVSLMYDIVDDEIVIEYPDLSINVCLIRPNITSFLLGNYEFVQVFDNAEGLDPGFYYKIYGSDNYTVYGARRKTILERLSRGTTERTIVERLDLYFKPKDSSLFIPVTGSQNFLTNFRFYRQEIDHHLRSQGLVYKEDPEHFIRSALTFLDETTKM